MASTDNHITLVNYENGQEEENRLQFANGWELYVTSKEDISTFVEDLESEREGPFELIRFNGRNDVEVSFGVIRDGSVSLFTTVNMEGVTSGDNSNYVTFMQTIVYDLRAILAKL